MGRQKKDKGDEEKIIIKPSALPEKQKSKPETDDEAEEKERKRVSDHFAERQRQDKGEEEKIIIKPSVLPTSTLDISPISDSDGKDLDELIRYHVTILLEENKVSM